MFNNPRRGGYSVKRVVNKHLGLVLLEVLNRIKLEVCLERSREGDLFLEEATLIVYSRTHNPHNKINKFNKVKRLFSESDLGIVIYSKFGGLE